MRFELKFPLSKITSQSQWSVILLEQNLDTVKKFSQFVRCGWTFRNRKIRATAGFMSGSSCAGENEHRVDKRNNCE